MLQEVMQTRLKSDHIGIEMAENEKLFELGFEILKSDHIGIEIYNRKD